MVWHGISGSIHSLNRYLAPAYPVLSSVLHAGRIAVSETDKASLLHLSSGKGRWNEEETSLKTLSSAVKAAQQGGLVKYTWVGGAV